MFRSVYRLVGPFEPLVKHWPVGASPIKTGQVVALSSGLAVPAAASAAAGTVLGVAAGTAPAGGEVPVVLSGDVVYEVEYTGTTKTTLTDADLGTSFNIAVNSTTGDMKLNLDDTVDAFCKVVAYDNDKKTAHVVIGNRVF